MITDAGLYIYNTNHPKWLVVPQPPNALHWSGTVLKTLSGNAARSRDRPEERSNMKITTNNRGLTMDTACTQQRTENGKRGRAYVEDAVYTIHTDSTLPLPSMTSGQEPVFELSPVRILGTRHESTWNLYFSCGLRTKMALPQCVVIHNKWRELVKEFSDSKVGRTE